VELVHAFHQPFLDYPRYMFPVNKVAVSSPGALSVVVLTTASLGEISDWAELWLQESSCVESPREAFHAGL
jgi:hypothetical protein